MVVKSVLKSIVRYFQRGQLRTVRRGKNPVILRSTLFVEVLEGRELLAAAPTIVSVNPPDGTVLTNQNSPDPSKPIIQVTYSEAMTSSAATATNYLLLDSAGNRVTIDSATLDGTSTVVTLAYNSGNPLAVDTYTLFVRGDRIFDVNDGLSVARPNQLVVANAGRNNVSVVNLDGDSSLGAMSTYSLPPVGTQAPNPIAVAFGDFDGADTLDMAIVNAGTNTVSIFSGNSGASGFGFSLTPDLTLQLATGAANQLKDIAIADFNKDGLDDIAVMNQNTNNVTVYLNTRTSAGTLSFDNGTSLTGLVTPVAMVLGDFDGDGYVDIAVANSALSGINYTVTVFRNNQAGGFSTAIPFTVGTNDTSTGTTTGLQAPIALAAGRFDQDAKTDLAVAGSNGIVLLTNTSSAAGNVTFNVGSSLLYTGTGIANLATDRVDAGTTEDLLAGTTNNQVIALLNNGAATPTFLASTVGSVTGGTGGRLATTKNYGYVSGASYDPTGQNAIVITSFGHGLATGDQVLISGVAGNTAANGTYTVTRVSADAFILNNRVGNAAYTGGGIWTRVNGVSEILVTSGAATGKVSVLSGTTGFGTIADATNNSPILVTSYGHGLLTGDQVVISGVAGNTAANGTFTVVRVSADVFSLTGSAGNGAYTVGGTWARTGSISDASNAGPIVITTPSAHRLTSGTQVTISGVGGNAAANGTFVIDVIDSTHFRLIGTTGSGAYTSGGTWVVAAPLALDTTVSNGAYSVDGTPMGVAIADTDSDGKLDVVTANRTGNTFSLLLGDGKRSFQQTSNTALTPTVTAAIAFGDVNGDGYRDIVVANNTNTASNSKVSILLGKADGSYQTPVDLGVAGSGSTLKLVTSIVLGDLNGDKKLDIILVGQGTKGTTTYNGAAGILLNNISNPGNPITNASFTAQPVIQVGDNPTQVVLGDFNEDGKLDMAVSHNRGGGGGGGSSRRGVTILLGNGDGTFQNRYEISAVGGQSATGLAILDYNKDGHQDLVVSVDSFFGARVYLLQGNGKGGFTSVGNYNPNINNPGPISVGDFNGDGYVDVVVASTSTNQTSGGISVLLNQLGTGLGTVVHSDVQPGTALASLVVTDINLDGILDVIVGTAAQATGATGSTDNVYVLMGKNDGSFYTAIPYLAGNVGTAQAASSYLAIGQTPLVRVTTFRTGGTVVLTNLVTNGDFESPDLNGEKGNLTGWQTYKLPDVPTGSVGSWGSQTSTISPLSGTTVASPDGQYQAMLDQANLKPLIPGAGNQPPTNPNAASTYSGSHALYQDVTIPTGVQSAAFSLRLYINSDSVFSDSTTPQILDYRTSADNQQVRVDIMSPTAGILSINPTDILQNLYLTKTNTAKVLTTTITADLKAFAGQTIRIRIATTNNQGRLTVGVDDVKLTVKMSDNVAPTISGVQLRNPGFMVNNVPTTTDPTITGVIADNGGLANIQSVEFDTDNNGFSNDANGISSDNFKITTWDAAGNFSFSFPSTLPRGQRTIGVRVFDKAGNYTTTTFTFDFQEASPLEWQAAAPNSIDVGTQGVDYTAVTGRITSVAVDPSDPSGKTYYVGTANGGVWKTTNAGNSWAPLMDYLTDSSGNRIYAPIGSVAVSKLNPQIVYAGTGVADLGIDSRPGSGVLKSIDGGKTWGLAGNSSTVLAGARISKIVIDNDNPSIVYAAVAAGGASGPGVYKTTDGGVTWVNILVPTTMTPVGSTSTLPAGTALASVTDLVIDPFNPNRLLVGLGNVGLVAGSTTAGMWLTTNKGGSWAQIGGGAGGIANSTLPTGANVGVVKIAMGNGRIGDERYVYVFIGTVPGNNTPPNVSLGGFDGLYKTSNNMLNFTKVMLRQDQSTSPPYRSFQDINLGVETSYASAIVVDPSNPNVVYVGGSTQYSSSNLTHALIRVDTGNMLDYTSATNNGDDAYKAYIASTKNNYYDDPNPYTPGGSIDTDPYKGEGVYWYDIIEAGSANTGNKDLLPSTIHYLTFDSQGRLLIGTEGGIWRGIGFGYGYDYTSGGTGIVRGNTSKVPGMSLTSINGNLQIASLTSVALDPLVAGQYYVTMIGSGAASNDPSGLLSWGSQGLTGPGNLGIPTAGLIRAASPPPGAPSDTPTTLFRLWQYANSNSLIPEISGDNGATWTSLSATGIDASSISAGYFATLAINPTKIYLPSQGIYVDELLFGGDVVYKTQTSSNVWDKTSPVLSNKGGLISALAIAPSGTSFYYAGTDKGEIFVAPTGGGLSKSDWPERDTGLPSLPVTHIEVDPNDQNVAYVTFGGNSTTQARVYKTTDAGQNWTNISGNLPKTAAYSLVVDRRPALGAPNGKIYLATITGVYATVDEGKNWVRVGASLPTVPVVDLQLDKNSNTLAAATQGRSLFTISVGAISPITDKVTDEDTPTGPIKFTLNDLGVSGVNMTVSASSDNQTLIPNANIILAGTGNVRTINLIPAANQFGTANITLTVTDGTNTFNYTFKLTVNSVNDLPTITPPTNASAPVNTTIGPLSFTVGDIETPANSLVVTAVVDNTTLFPAGSITLGGSGANRTITLTPKANTAGVAVITLTVTDADKGSTTTTFAVQVSANATLPFSDDFNRINNPYLGAQWVDEVGDFQTVDATPGSAATGQARSMGMLSLTSLRGVSEDNLFVQASINVTAASNQVSGLVLRHTGTGDSNYYLGTVVSSGGVLYAQIYKNINGAFTLLSSQVIASASGTLRFEAVGSSLKLFLNGNLQTAAQDYSITAKGTAGMRGYNGSIFDDFSAGLLTPVTPSLPFSDDFSSPRTPTSQLSLNWQETVGNFQIDGSGKAKGNSLFSLAVVNGVNEANVSVQAAVAITAGSNQAAGLVARYAGTGDSNYYLGMLFNTGGAIQAQIYKNVNGTFTLLSSAVVGTGTGTLLFEVYGTSLKLSMVNGSAKTLLTFANDAALSSGSVGMRAYNGATLDDFSADKLTKTNPSLPATDNFTDSDGSTTTTQLSAQWTDQVGDFTVDTNQAKGNSLFALATLNGVNETNVSVQASVAITAGSNQAAGLVARYAGTGDSNYYLGMLFNTGGAIQAQIYKNVNGTFTLLSSAVVGTGTGTLLFEVYGTSLKLSMVNGSAKTLLTFANDAALSSGSVGMRAYNFASLDDFSADKLAKTNPGLPATDDFTDSDGSTTTTQLSAQWTDQVGDFTVDTNQAKGVAGAVSLATLNGVNEANVSVQAAVAITGSSNQAAGLVARYAGAGDSNYYVGVLYGNGGTISAQILKNINGVYSVLSSTTVTGGTGTLIFEVYGTSLKLSLDNGTKTLLTSASDTALASGSVGIRSFNGATLDDFSASKPTLPTLTYTDNFDTGTQLSSDWVGQSGNFQLVSQKAQGNATGVSLATLNGISETNVSVQAAVAVTGSSNQAAGLVARYSGMGDSNYYVGTLYGSGGTITAQILKNINGAYTLLSSTTVASGTGTLRFDVSGNSLKLFLDNTLLANAFDTSLSTGSVGIRTFGGATFDNFSASKPTPPSLTYTDGFTATTDKQLKSDWISQVGNFQTDTNQATGIAGAVSLATLNGISETNVSVQAKVAITGSSNQAAGLVARYQGAGDSNYYVGTLYGNGGTISALILKNINGAYTVLSSTTVSSGTGTLIFQVYGNSLKLFLDDGTTKTLLTLANDTALARGSVGIRSFNGAALDDFSASKPTPPSLPYTDNFTNSTNKELKADWVSQVGNFQTVNNQATGTGTISLAALNGVSATNAYVQASIAIGANSNQAAGLVARYSGSGDQNYYMAFIYNVGGVTSAQIYKNLNGVFTLLNSTTVASGSGTYRFEVIGSSLTLKFGGNTILATTDTSIAAGGSVGIRSYNGAALDDFAAGTLP